MSERIDLDRMRDLYTPKEIASTYDGEEIVFCEDFEGQYVGWAPRELAERRGYTIAMSSPDPWGLPLVEAVVAAVAFEDASERPPFPLSSEQAMRWVELKKALAPFRPETASGKSTGESVAGEATDA